MSGVDSDVVGIISPTMPINIVPDNMTIIPEILFI
jgi:hypothetical protein